MQFATTVHGHLYLGVPVSSIVIVKIFVSGAMGLLENVLYPAVVTSGWDQAVNTVIFLIDINGPSLQRQHLFPKTLLMYIIRNEQRLISRKYVMSRD